MQLRQPTADALLHFSDYLLERFGLVASMQVALVASVACHAFAIVGLGFKVPDPRGFDAPHNVLDVVLVNAKSATKPAKADALAQANLDGGGNTDAEAPRLEPVSGAWKAARRAPEVKQAQSRVQQLEREATELMTRLKSQAAVAPPDPVGEKNDKPDKTAQDLIEKSLEIQRLEAQIRRDYQAYQERPRKKFIGARTSEYRFAMYVDNWRLKIERIGNLNYPDEARQAQALRVAAAHGGAEARWRSGIGGGEPLLGPQGARPGGGAHRAPGRALRPLPRRHPGRHRHPLHHAHVDLRARRSAIRRVGAPRASPFRRVPSPPRRPASRSGPPSSPPAHAAATRMPSASPSTSGRYTTPFTRVASDAPLGVVQPSPAAMRSRVWIRPGSTVTMSGR